MTSNKLYLSDTDKKIAGVCGGLSDYFDIDSTIIRIVWLVASLTFGTGIILYIAFWIVVPREKNILP